MLFGSVSANLWKFRIAVSKSFSRSASIPSSYRVRCSGHAVMVSRSRCHFCRTCGCNLFAYDDDETTLFYVDLPTLDGGVDPRHPKDMESHIYMRSKAEWEYVSDAIPHFDKEGPGEIITAIQKTET